MPLYQTIVNGVIFHFLSIREETVLLVSLLRGEPVPAGKGFIPFYDLLAIYEKLFAEYVTLYDYFGRGENDVMKRLKAIKAEVRG